LSERPARRYIAASGRFATALHRFRKTQNTPIERVKLRGGLFLAETSDELMAFLSRLGIETRTTHHPPLHTVEESRALRGEIPGAHTKNLFLKDKKDSVFLVVAPEDAVIDLKGLHHRIGASGRLSFGKPDLLMTLLGVAPGSVSPFGLINDKPPRVNVILDAALMANKILNCHPLVNTATTSIAGDDLISFIRATGHEPAILKVSEAAGETL
jgi:Ala-tRNA(Pro) deacylase